MASAAHGTATGHLDGVGAQAKKKKKQLQKLQQQERAKRTRSSSPGRGGQNEDSDDMDAEMLTLGMYQVRGDEKKRKVRADMATYTHNSAAARLLFHFGYLP